MARKKQHHGRCALTGNEAPFVKCHILPRALTRPSTRGDPLFQSTKGNGEQRRWTSWYDQKLVSRAGEDLLSRIDDDAIKVMRKQMLIWSSWLVFTPKFENFNFALPDHGYRNLKIQKPEYLIRFALSVAWRASASSLPDMQDCNVEDEIQERLREYVLGKEIVGVSDFPVSLTQLSTVGLVHNQTPTVDDKSTPSLSGFEGYTVRIMRIYLDGLIFHVHLSPIPAKHLEGNSIFLGAAEEAIVTSVSYEASHQYENLLHVMRECQPSLIERSAQ